MKGLLLGFGGGTHIGESLLRAAKHLNTPLHFIDYGLAHRGPPFVQKIAYHFFDRRPSAMNFFNRKVIEHCCDVLPHFVLATGCAPLNAKTLKILGAMGIKRINYLTDDPWNSAHRSRWFLKALPNYDVIFSVRRANMGDLKLLGCPRVMYLPFGYDPDLFYPGGPTEDQKSEYESDILFVGGADKDRLPYIVALIRAGHRVRLHGLYWDRFKETQHCAFGLGNPQTIRIATACTKIALCLVRRANRDDNCMRTFEIPAVGACMLAEDTQGHREIFGAENQALLYFSSVEEMLKKTQYLIAQPKERHRLAVKSQQTILRGLYSYSDRLKIILETF